MRSEMTALCAWKTTSTGSPSPLQHQVQVCLGLGGGAFPGEALGEPARLHAERTPPAPAMVGQPAHGGRERVDVAMRAEESGLAVAHRFADPGRIGRHDRCPARRRLEIRDAPALLRRGERERPGASQQRDLVGLADAPKKPYPLAEVKRGRQPLERGPMVARPRRSPAARQGRRARAKARSTRSTRLYRLSRPRYANSGSGARAPAQRRVAVAVDAAVDDADVAARECRARTRSSAVLSLMAWNGTPRYTQRNRTLGEPDRGRQRGREFLETPWRRTGAAPAPTTGVCAPPRRVERHLVDVLDDHVEAATGEPVAEGAARRGTGT